ncbi:tripartite tricarboxylate transporter substrate-binding protein [Alkalibacter saccharofermentans]|uniref:Tripartite-type tricarboxylate transporter, receptor component TctC n=1 Tax=Alkalibacter saccharofermentans DSM 14828 TaxID=1120975 RepID=A0A1M4WFK3_9FIRM|nr:tripartite tricarboxylate transporter substrate-binding protein [Alkalibacter saccharofermentans]SHE80071.1 Tripartite-type tricarboxylate transporter, receptor component TctC [Alkalibacter saccharofermentans DSM 14828]
MSKKGKMKKRLAVVAALMLVAMVALTGCAGKKSIRVLIGSTAVTGDTYQTADFITRAIADDLNADMRVDPVGSSEMFRELGRAGTDGSTIALFHDYTFLGTLYGAYEENWLEEFQVGPTISINAGTCLAVMANNEYGIEDWDSLVEAARENVIVFGIEEGSVSNYISEQTKRFLVDNEGVPEENIQFSALGGMSAQREALWAGTIDVFNGSYSADIENTAERGNTDERTTMNIIALTGRDRLDGVDIPTLGELTNGRLFYDKEFFFITQKETDADFIKELEDAVKDALENDEELKAQFAQNQFMANFKTLEESVPYFNEKMESARQIIESGR